MEKLEADRDAPPPTKASVPTVRFVPPPPPLQSTSSYSPPSPAAASISPPPRPYMGGGGKGDAVALYDFEAQGEDELDILEGERLIVIVGGSDDADWIKCRKVGSDSEGVVPASYVQVGPSLPLHSRRSLTRCTTAGRSSRRRTIGGRITSGRRRSRSRRSRCPRPPSPNSTRCSRCRSTTSRRRCESQIGSRSERFVEEEGGCCRVCETEETFSCACCCAVAVARARR